MAKLFFEDGTAFEGEMIGADKPIVGELCFNTSMTGYQEIFTDPSYAGQVITMTNSHIGNTGSNLEDFESKKVHAKAVVLRNFEIEGFNYRNEKNLNDFLDSNGISVAYGFDTRAIVRRLRNNGAMNCLITNDEITGEEAAEFLKKQPALSDLDFLKEVSCDSAYDLSKEGSKKLAIIDCGVKQNILDLWQNFDYQIRVFPSSVTLKEVNSFAPDALFITNGPGDPMKAEQAIKVTKEFLEKIPVLGICLGMQIISLALGAESYKLKYGHRGANHPVKDMRDGVISITSQNHGYAIKEESLPEGIEVSHKNWNDFTVAGIYSKDKGILAVQHHPESSPGPHDARNIFQEFNDVVKKFYA